MFILYKLILFTYLLKYYIDFTSYKLGIFNSMVCRHVACRQSVLEGKYILVIFPRCSYVSQICICSNLS